MRLYLDDDLDSNALIRALRRAGHAVTSPREAGTRGVDDEEHLRFAAEEGLVLLTANAGDFVELHRAWTLQHRHHAGILIVYRENNPSRDMNLKQIALAVGRVDRSRVPLADNYFNLNFWRRASGG